MIGLSTLGREKGEKVNNTYLHTRLFRGEKRTDNSSNDS